VAIGLWVAPRAWSLLRETTNVLLEGAPKGMDVDAVRAAMKGADGVADVHDLHVWEIASGLPSLSAHLVVQAGHDADTVRRGVARELERQFKIAHVTIQTEVVACDHDCAPARRA
jgi:cobalt-zinc-cadmium efflux system protein